jgi:pyruvate dehydrogenase E1 component
MEGLFRTLGIYSSIGQLYDPVDADQVMYYREHKEGQILQEGLSEAGSMSSFIAAGTSYSSHAVQMIPFYIFYSMFGFQRIGDLAWAAGDNQARGFLLGGTSGRTTLAGEGLQHQDGHSHVLGSTIPNCRAYDPTFAYELAVILHEGLLRMVRDQENVFYYVTLLNENYAHPPMPEGVREGIVRGMYAIRSGKAAKLRVQLLGSGAILREVLAAAELLEADWEVGADVWSCTSLNELRRDGLDCERWNLLHPEETPRQGWVERCLAGRSGPVIAATDYMRAHADQIRPYIAQRYKVLGTDGYGRSDTRKRLREFFEVDRHWITLAALKALADDGEVPATTVSAALARYGLDPKKPNPVTV